MILGRYFKELLLLSLCGILTIVVIPFAILRVIEQHWSVALLDISIIVLMLSIFVHIYVTRETRIPGIILALIFVIAALGSVFLQGFSQIFWLYPALASTFFLLDARFAIALNALSLLLVGLILWGALSATDFATIYLTLLTNILFAGSFALTARQQEFDLQRLATADPLTGAGNRRAQNQKLDAINALYRRSHIPASILIMDVDHFKAVNDTHGHVAGDQILVELVDLIRSNSRPTETLYRYGGEEFVVIAENTTLEGAMVLAEKLRALVESRQFVSGIRFTVSLGVAALHAGEGRQGWLSRADTALFKAKQDGRNRVVAAAEPVDTAAMNHS